MLTKSKDTRAFEFLFFFFFLFFWLGRKCKVHAIPKNPVNRHCKITKRFLVISHEQKPEWSAFPTVMHRILPFSFGIIVKTVIDKKLYKTHTHSISLSPFLRAPKKYISDKSIETRKKNTNKKTVIMNRSTATATMAVEVVQKARVPNAHDYQTMYNQLRALMCMCVCVHRESINALLLFH